MRRCDCVLAHLNLEMAMASFDDGRFLILNVNLTWGLSGIEVLTNVLLMQRVTRTIK